MKNEGREIVALCISFSGAQHMVLAVPFGAQQAGHFPTLLPRKTPLTTSLVPQELQPRPLQDWQTLLPLQTAHGALNNRITSSGELVGQK